MSDTSSTPGYDEGWFNGDPKQMIPFGSYEKYRERIRKGRSALDMKDLDVLAAHASKLRARDEKDLKK